MATELTLEELFYIYTLTAEDMGKSLHLVDMNFVREQRDQVVKIDEIFSRHMEEWKGKSMLSIQKSAISKLAELVLAADKKLS